MDWIILSLISLVTMTFMVLIMTAYIKKGFSSQFVLAIVTSVWLVGYSIWVLFEGINFSISEVVWIILILTGIGGVITNWFLFEAAASAPNPGFPLAISNTSPALIAIFSIFFLNSELSISKFLAILIIISGVVIINFFSEESKGKKGKFWIIQAFIVLFLSAIFSLILTWLIKQGLSTAFILAVIGLIYVISYYSWAYKKGINYKITFKVIYILIGAGILSVIGNWTILEAAASAPNPGYAFAIGGAKPALITILAVFTLKSELKPIQLLGVGLTVIGIIIIVL